MESFNPDNHDNFERSGQAAMVLSAVTLWSSIIGTSTKGGAISVPVAEGVSERLYEDQI